MRFLHIYWGNRPGPCSSHQALLSATHTPKGTQTAWLCPAHKSLILGPGET